VGPFGFCDGTFDRHVVYFSVVVLSLSLAFKVCIGASGDCEFCAMGWEGFILLLGFLDLSWRWRWCIIFSFYFGIAVLRWIGSLRNCWRVSYLRSWWGYVICGTCGACGWFVVA
jgi:hypothetical protein